MDSFKIIIDDMELLGNAGSPISIPLSISNLNKFIDPNFFALELLNSAKNDFLKYLDGQSLRDIEYFITLPASSSDIISVRINKEIEENDLVVYNFIDGTTLGYYSQHPLGQMINIPIEELGIKK